MKAGKAWGHGVRKTLEVIQRIHMVHQHVPLSLSHSQMALSLPPTIPCSIIIHTRSCAVPNTELWMQRVFFPCCSKGSLRGISSTLISKWEGFFTYAARVRAWRWKVLLQARFGEWKSAPPSVLFFLMFDLKKKKKWNYCHVPAACTVMSCNCHQLRDHFFGLILCLFTKEILRWYGSQN